MAEQSARHERVFKTAWFAKAAKKAHIGDDELCAAIRQVMQGQADDLGGGVYKKRLGKNLYRSIIIARGGRYWIYTYLFARQDLANIDDGDLTSLRDQAALYARKTELEIAREIQRSVVMEICDGKT